MASPTVPVQQRRIRQSGGAQTSHRDWLLIGGGIAGIVGTLAYGSTQALPFFDVLHTFPVEVSWSTRAAAFWIPALWPVLALFMVYVLYRLLDEGRTGHWAYLGWVSGVVAFSMVVMMMIIQSGVHFDVSDLARTDPTFSPEMWSSVVAAVHGVDNGLDLVWDLFLVLWLVLTGMAMMGHPRFGLRWGIPAVVIGVVLLVLNGITVPDPPASAGLFDAGPLAGFYAFALSVYILVLGIRSRTRVPATSREKARDASPNSERLNA